MQSPSPSPPPTSSASEGHSGRSPSTGTTSSYSSPFSHQDPSESPQASTHSHLHPHRGSSLEPIKSGLSGGMVGGPQDVNAIGMVGDDVMGMFGSSGAVPTLGELMMMDMDMGMGMGYGSPGMDMGAVGPGDSGMMNFPGMGSGGSVNGMGGVIGVNMAQLTGNGVSVEKLQKAMAMSAAANGNGNGRADIRLDQGSVPAPRNSSTSPTNATHPASNSHSIASSNPSASTSTSTLTALPSLAMTQAPAQGQPQQHQQGMTQRNGVAGPSSGSGMGQFGSSQGQGRPTQQQQQLMMLQQQLRQQQQQQQRSSQHPPQSPPQSSTSNRSAKSLGKARASEDFASSMAIPAPQPNFSFPGVPSTSTSNSTPSSAPQPHLAKPKPAPRRKRANGDAPSTSARSGPSSSGTGTGRRKNVSARNMGGDGSSEEDELGEDDEEDWEGKNGMGLGGRGRARMWVGVGAGERASWRVVEPPKEEVTDLPLMIRGIKRRGAKSRVETQIKFRICMVQPSTATQPHSMLGLDGMKREESPLPLAAPTAWERVATYKSLRLKPGVGMRKKPPKKGQSGPGDESGSQAGEEEDGEDGDRMLYLSSEVLCATTGKDAKACGKCVDREQKRAETRMANRPKPGPSESEDHSVEELYHTHNDPASASHGHLIDQEENHIISWNCGPVVELENGECELAARMVCYSRHHKEKNGFRMTLRLRDAEGKLVASATAPTILITDDHKTSVSKASLAAQAAAAVTANNETLLSPSQRSVTPSITSNRSEKSASKQRRVRDDSVSLDGEAVKAASRAAKSKPYSRKSTSETRSASQVSTGVLSPRTGLATHGLSMTPLHGRSIPGSPMSQTAPPNGSYFGLPVASGTGTISPGLVMMPGSDSQSPQGLSAALPAISQRLSDWAEDRSTDHSQSSRVQYSDSSSMQVDDEQWAYASSDGARASVSDGAESYMPAQMAMEGLHLGFGNGGQDFMMGPGGQDDEFHSDNGQHMGRNEPEPDFDSMLNLSPSAQGSSLPEFAMQAQSGGNSMMANLPPWISQVPNGQMMNQQGMQSMASGFIQQQQPQVVQQLQPKITRVIPPEGDIQGGTEVTILGENFTPGAMIFFGKSPAVTLQLYGPTTMVCLLPPSPTGAGTVPVVVRDSLQPEHTPEAGSMAVFFTYHDVSDRKLMEMALTAVGLRVTGKVVGAVEIARRIMSAPQPDGGSKGGEGSNGGAREMDGAEGEMDEETLAQELAQSVYSNSPQEFEQAIVKFLGAFLPDNSRTRRTDRYRPSNHATLNLINREGQTLLHFAALLGFNHLLALLLRAGATVDIHDRNGYTALAFAAMAGKESSVKGLLSAGAKLASCTFSNETPAMLAMRAGHVPVVRLLQHLASGSSSGSAHGRKASLSASDSSPDADNPSSATDTDSIDSADRELTMAMSPRKVTTADDINAVRYPERAASSMSVAKSDSTATPKARKTFSLPMTEIGSDGKGSRTGTEGPPPYAAADDASWLQRTLSHLPGSQQIIPMAPHLKDYLPPTLWDKLPSAQVLIPNMPDAFLRPGEMLENSFSSQAWLAVPLGAWLNAQPKPVQEESPAQTEEPQGRAKSSQVSGRTDSRSPAETRDKVKEDKVSGKSSARQSRGASARKPSRLKESKNGNEVSRSSQSGRTRMATPENQQQVAKLKPDRMLFFFWLPVLAAAFFYTLVTTLPVALGKALLGPVFRVIKGVL